MICFSPFLSFLLSSHFLCIWFVLFVFVFNYVQDLSSYVWITSSLLGSSMFWKMVASPLQDWLIGRCVSLFPNLIHPFMNTLTWIPKNAKRGWHLLGERTQKREYRAGVHSPLGPTVTHLWTCHLQNGERNHFCYFKPTDMQVCFCFCFFGSAKQQSYSSLALQQSSNSSNYQGPPSLDKKPTSGNHILPDSITVLDN